MNGLEIKKMIAQIVLKIVRSGENQESMNKMALDLLPKQLSNTFKIDETRAKGWVLSVLKEIEGGI